LHAEFAAKNTAILGCSIDSVSDNRTFAEMHEFSFPLLCDTDATVCSLFNALKPDGSKAARVTVVISAEGKIEFYDPKFSSRDGPQKLLDILN
jgi:peroxiredoxin Q/BCP